MSDGDVMVEERTPVQMIEPTTKWTHPRARQRPVSDVAAASRRVCLRVNPTWEDETSSVVGEPGVTGDPGRHIDRRTTRIRRPDPADDRLIHLATQLLTCALDLACHVDDAQQIRKARLYSLSSLA